MSKKGELRFRSLFTSCFQHSGNPFVSAAFIFPGEVKVVLHIKVVWGFPKYTYNLLSK